MKLVFATNNPHKFKEVRSMLPPWIELLKLDDIDCNDALPETGNTIEQNASQKARYVHDKFGVNCFADDTGLEVEALGGRPGVYSARFAGESADSEMNIEKLLTEMKGVTNRRAAFRTIIALIVDGKELSFEGRVDGSITEKLQGSGGFGYDPVFIPDGFLKTFSDLGEEEKNKISHRADAIRKLSNYLSGMR
jgi:XTP/dITP diphosphohydrolase